MPLTEIRKEDVQRFVIPKSQQGLAWETASHLRHLLSKVLDTAEAWGYLLENPARGVMMPERSLKRPRRFLKPQEVTPQRQGRKSPAGQLRRRSGFGRL